jgi:AcrR family transcriptional regulator
VRSDDPSPVAAAAGAEPDADDEAEPRAADGRVPGRRGRATRQRLLECTAEMLRTGSYRDIKVVDIAREAGTSPATFYQYFPDVESAILVLADEMVVTGVKRFSGAVSATAWRGRSGYAAAEELADVVLGFWEEHRAVLRVVDLATDEGDGRFANVRTRLLNDLNNSLAATTRELQKTGKGQQDVDPNAVAGVLVAMLAHVSAHRLGFEFWGVRTDDLRTAMARLLYWGVTAQKPPG